MVRDVIVLISPLTGATQSHADRMHRVTQLTPEPMIDYITPVGGGYFFAPPGTRGAGDWVGSGLA